jgi:hypothetical protein
MSLAEVSAPVIWLAREFYAAKAKRCGMNLRGSAEGRAESSLLPTTEASWEVSGPGRQQELNFRRD